MPRFVVVLPLQPLSPGDRFTTRDWPLHVTIVPVFTSTATAPDVAALLEVALPAVTIVAGPDEGFGPKNALPVTVVRPSAELDALHRSLVDALAPIAPQFQHPGYTLDGYRAHITVKRSFRAVEGERYRLEQLALVDMQPGQELGMRVVLAVSPLAVTPPPTSSEGDAQARR
jgi:hypothetical protein